MENTIFILGCGHSGTTIMNKIISNHKNIYGVNFETNIFLKYPLTIIYLNQLNKKRLLSGKKWLCEKTHQHVYYINKIFKFTKNPKIIVMIQDGRDVVASLYKRYGDLNKSINIWINDNNEWLNNNYNKHFLILKYEDFIKNSTEELKKVCMYLEEEYDDNMLNYEKETVSLPFKICDVEKIDLEKHEILRKYQVNQEIYDGTKRYLRDLTQDQLNLLYSNKKFMYLMENFGYKV